MFTQEDLLLLQEKHIAPQQVETQLKCFETGFPYLDIVQAASTEKGIVAVSDSDGKMCTQAWESYRHGGFRVAKFVPASGAASRMFKDLFAFAGGESDLPATDFEKQFFDNLSQFAFYDNLNDACARLYGCDIAALSAASRFKDIVNALLLPDGLNYGGLPKGLLLFHSYGCKRRTPVEEHLAEGTRYAAASNGRTAIHFTVSPEHLPLFEKLVDERKGEMEERLGVEFDVSYSVQKPSTDTIAVDADNKPFRDNDGNLLFRPGGHGALIENLNDIDADVVFIKNIDNVSTEGRSVGEMNSKRLLAGMLVLMQERAFRYVRRLRERNCTSAELAEMLSFSQNELCTMPRREFANDAELSAYLLKKLDRPFRVCGMVKNEGEPGGGPFIAVNADGSASLQILESSQIDRNNGAAMDAFRNGSHFNPVDLVCGIKDCDGRKYDLTKYVDPNTGFISHKSKDGRELKALELPGLWNGAMSDWNTIFVEVPVETFNPVKTVNDLLKVAHR